MKDESKRWLIRFLNKADSYQAKALPGKGWDDETNTRDEGAWRRQADDDLSALSGKDLNRELRRQILVSLPIALFLLAMIAALIWILINA